MGRRGHMGLTAVVPKSLDIGGRGRQPSSGASLAEITKGVSTMTKRKVSLILLILGIVILLAAVTADMTGLGGQLGFGWKQTAGTILGAIVAIVGGVLYSRR